MDYFSIVIEQLGMFIFYAIVGVIAVKANILNRNGLNMISKLIIKILMPLMLFTNTYNGTTKEEIISSAWIMVGTVVYYIILLIVGLALKGAFRMKGNEGRVYCACTTFSNIGFMGIPVVAALFPEHGVLYISLFTIVDQLILWTVGVELTLPVDGGIKYTAKEKMLKMINPCTVGILLSVAFVMFGIPIPSLINTAASKIGACTSPLALVYLGGVFTFVKLGDYVKKIEIYGMIVVKQLIAPIIVFFVMRLMPGLNTEMVVTFAVLAAMPTMASIAMLAQNQNSAGDYAAGMIFITTVLSIITLPIVCIIIGML